LSTLYSGMRVPGQDRIADHFGLSDGRAFATWLRSLNSLRNVCARHSRLCNRNVVDQPKLCHR
jgi:abortive infection bacteriophage resistance protein